MNLSYRSFSLIERQSSSRIVSLKQTLRFRSLFQRFSTLDINLARNSFTVVLEEWDSIAREEGSKASKCAQLLKIEIGGEQFSILPGEMISQRFGPFNNTPPFNFVNRTVALGREGMEKGANPFLVPTQVETKKRNYFSTRENYLRNRVN